VYYPSRLVTLTVPFPAGDGVDAMARITAERLIVTLGQEVVIENRGGAAGVIGTRAAAKALPDGYTLVMSQRHDLDQSEPLRQPRLRPA
jgi:tripartite-type tricarboxylate transporter receptor subunit TctC